MFPETNLEGTLLLLGDQLVGWMSRRQDVVALFILFPVTHIQTLPSTLLSPVTHIGTPAVPVTLSMRDSTQFVATTHMGTPALPVTFSPTRESTCNLTFSCPDLLLRTNAKHFRIKITSLGTRTGRVLDFLSVNKPNQGTRNGIYAVIRTKVTE